MYTQADADLANQNLVLAWNEHAVYLEDTYQHPPMRLAEVEALAAHPPKSLLWVANVLLRYPWRVSEQVLDVMQEHLLWAISAGGDAVLFPELDEAEEWLTSEQARSLARSRNVSNLLVWFLDRFDVTHQRAWDFCHAAMDANGGSLEDISSILAGQRVDAGTLGSLYRRVVKKNSMQELTTFMSTARASHWLPDPIRLEWYKNREPQPPVSSFIRDVGQKIKRFFPSVATASVQQQTEYLYEHGSHLPFPSAWGMDAPAKDMLVDDGSHPGLLADPRQLPGAAVFPLTDSQARRMLEQNQYGLLETWNVMRRHIEPLDADLVELMYEQVTRPMLGSYKTGHHAFSVMAASDFHSNVLIPGTLNESMSDVVHSAASVSGGIIGEFLNRPDVPDEYVDRLVKETLQQLNDHPEASDWMINVMGDFLTHHRVTATHLAKIGKAIWYTTGRVEANYYASWFPQVAVSNPNLPVGFMLHAQASFENTIMMKKFWFDRLAGPNVDMGADYRYPLQRMLAGANPAVPDLPAPMMVRMAEKTPHLVGWPAPGWEWVPGS